MEGSLKGALKAFNSARLFCPHKADTMKPVASDVDSLKSFPFWDELPQYLAKCTDTDKSVCPLTWWKRNSDQLPVWAAAFRKVLLIQQRSAASERFFAAQCFLQ